MPVVDAYIVDKVKGVGSSGKPVSFEFSPVAAGSFVMGAADGALDELPMHRQVIRWRLPMCGIADASLFTRRAKIITMW